MSVEDLKKLISPKFTENVLYEIINKKCSLSEVQISNIKMGSESKKGDSYLSTIIRFVIEATGKNKKNQKEDVAVPVIVKAVPANIGRRKTYRSYEFFKNETIFYEKVWPALQKFQDSRKVQDKFDNVPLLLSACSDGVNDYIALEDLSYQGFGQPRRSQGLNYEQAVRFLNFFAKFNGLALAFKDQQPEQFEEAATSLEETYFAEKFRNWYKGFQGLLYNVVRDAVEKELPAEYVKRFDEVMSNDFFGKLCKLSEVRGPLSVISHGDTWLPNFLVKYAADDSTPLKVVMVDFQLTRYTTLSNDLIFFLHTCVDTDVLEKRWDDFITEYHKMLADTLEKYGSDRNLVTLEALKADIKASMAFGIGMSMEALTVALLDDSEVFDLDLIQGDEAVPIESIWVLKPIEVQEKRRRVASMIKSTLDKGFK